MAQLEDVEVDLEDSQNDDSSSLRTKSERRKIPGNLPYTSSAGVLKRVLERIPVTEKPSQFNADWLRSVYQTTGGSARPVIPILKSAGLLSQTGAPTELYTRFQTEAGRSSAALQALKNAFSEIFKRNQYAYRDNEAALLDVIVAVTGLPKSEAIVRNIAKTFQCFQSFIGTSVDAVQTPADGDVIQDARDAPKDDTKVEIATRSVGLVYNINIVLPETTNIEVYNTIFKALKGNLLHD